MKAWLLDNIGDGIDKLRLTDVDDPKPGPGEVILRTTYAGLNPADRYLSEGQYPAKPPLPHILGRDGLGVVERIGADVTVDPQDAGWTKKRKEQLAPRRVKLAIDNIGGPLFPQMLETLGDQGRVSVVGRLAGPAPQFNTSSLLFRRLRVGGVQVG